MKKITIFISILLLAISAFLLVVRLINKDSYKYFISRLEKQLEEKFEITKLDEDLYDECAEEQAILPHEGTIIGYYNETSHYWNYAEYKDEEVNRYRLTQTNFLGDSLANEINNVFYCKRESFDGMMISCEIMNFNSSEAAGEAFQMYSKLMEDTYNEHVNNEYRGAHFLRQPYMGIQVEDNYSIYSRIGKNNDTVDDIFFLKNSYFVQLQFVSKKNDIHYLSYIEFLNEMGFPDPRTVKLLKEGVEPITEE